MKTNTDQLTRRAFGGVAATAAWSATSLLAWTQQPSMEQKPPTSASVMRTSLHQELEFSAPPERIFKVLLDPAEFAAMTGMPAIIDPSPGGTFKTFGGLIEGRNVEIIAGRRIVQAWRPTSWNPGVYSIVHFELNPVATGTRLVLDHTGFPEGDFDHLDSGWYQRYWDPLKKYLAAHR